MAKLPLGKAKDLAEDMASKGIPGMIKMDKPVSMGSGDEADDAPEKDPAVDPELLDIAGEIINHIDAGDKEGLAKCLEEICQRCIEKYDKDEPEDEGPDESME